MSQRSINPHNCLSTLAILCVALLPSSPALAQSVGQAARPLTKQGNQIRINGRPYSGAWAQWSSPSTPGQMAIGISDSGLRQRLGFGLLDTNDVRQQPVQWFSAQPIPLRTQFNPTGTYRHLDITALSRTLGWQLQPQGNVLQITTPPATVQQVRLGRQVWGRRIVIGLDRPAPWRMTRLTNSRNGKTKREFTLSVDATASPSLLKTVKVAPGKALKALSLSRTQGHTVLKGAIAGSVQPSVSMLTNPHRLVVDIRPTPAKSRNILWAPGLRWREQLVQMGNRRYPVVWLAINPRQTGLKLQPIWGNPNALVGLQPLATMAPRAQAAAAINGGFFNRKTQTPLGAIRRNHTWISSPILNRGVVAWNGQGQFQMGRLRLQDLLTTNTGRRFPVVSSDSGYPSRGIARYTRTWGPSYKPLTGNEQIITVVGDRVMTQRSGKSATAFPIPANGYLLVVRSFNSGTALAPGTQLQTQMATSPATFNTWPDMLGAGPLLVQNGRVVLNPGAEKFRPPFDTQAAPRSGIGQTADGTVLLAAVHNRLGGPGPTLREWALILRQLGAVNALNLDGGSSTALYLGGQLLDRHPVTAARVQNGIGVFVQPQP